MWQSAAKLLNWRKFTDYPEREYKWYNGIHRIPIISFGNGGNFLYLCYRYITTINNFMNYLFYSLTSTSNEQAIRYIGVTSTTLKIRFSGHMYNARHDKKRSQPVHKWMYSELQKGYEIKINLIDSVEQNWEEKEKELILKYKNMGHNLLNVSEGGAGVITKEMRAQSGIERSIEAHRKKIIAIDKNTLQVYKEFNSIREANAFFGNRKGSAISNVLNKRSESSNGYYWLYKEDYEKTGVTSLLPYAQPKIKYNAKLIYQFDITGKLIQKHDSIANAKKALNIKSSEHSFYNAVNNHTLYHNSFWSFEEQLTNFQSYIDHSFPYVEYDNENIINRYQSQAEICRVFHINASVLCETLKQQGYIIINNHKIQKIKI